MSDTPTTPTPPEPTRPPRRWFRRLVVGLVVLLGLVGLAPNLVGWLGLSDVIARQALGDLAGKVTVGGASLGWFSRIDLRDVTLTDADGATVATVPRVVSSRTLLGLAWDQSNLGEFRVERPTLHVVADDAGTNVERVLAKYLQPSDRPAGPTPVLTLRVTDATVNVRDAVTKRTTTLEKGSVVVTLPPGGAAPTISASAGVHDATPGSLTAEATLGPAGQAKLTLDAVPLDRLTPALRRLSPGTTLAGRLTADAAVSWGEAGLTLTGKVRGRGLVVDSPALQGDMLRLTSLDLPLDVTAAGKRVTVRQADLRCDAGTVTVRGTFDAAEPLDRLLTRPGQVVEAQIDLAQVANLLPRRLAIRDGTTLREGNLVVKLSSRAEAPSTVWTGEVRTSALKADRDGRQLRWDEPLQLTFTSRVRPGELPAFDQFACRSEFLTATASGSAEKVNVEAALSLDRLVARLADFVDLGGTTLAGTGQVKIQATRTPAGDLHIQGGFELNQLAYADPAGRSFREPNLKATLDARGRLAVGQPVRIDAGTATVAAAGDLLSVALREPIADASGIDQATAALSLSGDLARWRSRAAGFVKLPRDLQLAGTGTITAVTTMNPTLLRLDKVGVDLDKAVVRGFGVAVEEPKLVASAAHIVVGRVTGKVEATDVRVGSATVALNVPQAALEPVPAGYRVVASGSVQADLARLQRTLQLTGERLAGGATGTFRCTADGAATQFGADLDVTNFAYGTTWAEPQAKLHATGSVDPAKETLRLEAVRLSRDALAVEAAGTLTRWASTRDVALKGTLTYDLARLSPTYREFLGSGFQATGQGKRDFSVTGPLASLRAVTANAAVGWQSVRAYGLDIGPGELRLNLADGVLTTNAIEAGFATGGGKARVQPTVRLDPAPQELTIAPGTIIDRAKLTPQATAQALGYALPVIAHSNATEGEFSFVLEGNRIPLAAPTQATLHGKLVIHRAHVAAGPLTAEIAKLLRANQTSVTLASENVVPVRVENGRVHHENLTLKVNDFTVKTRGSVGLDGSLALVAEVPVPAGLLGSNPKVVQALAGRPIPVPIGGTLTQPRLDPVAFQQEVARMVAEAARDTLRETGRDLLEKQLDKVLPGKGLDKFLPIRPK